MWRCFRLTPSRRDSNRHKAFSKQVASVACTMDSERQPLGVHPVRHSFSVSMRYVCRCQSIHNLVHVCVCVCVFVLVLDCWSKVPRYIQADRSMDCLGSDQIESNPDFLFVHPSICLFVGRYTILTPSIEIIVDPSIRYTHTHTHAHTHLLCRQ